MDSRYFSLMLATHELQRLSIYIGKNASWDHDIDITTQMLLDDCLKSVNDTRMVLYKTLERQHSAYNQNKKP